MKYQLPFGTHGIRGNAQQVPFTKKHLASLAQALELFIETKNIPKGIIIGYDTRTSAPFIKTTLCKNFTQALSIADAGILPTPALIQTLKKNPSFGLGIMITASHNPAQDNGLKFFLQGGVEISKEDEIRIQNLFDQSFLQPIDEAQTKSTNHSYDYSFELYFTQIKKKFAPRFLSGLHIGLDCANGATSSYAPIIFRHFGAKVTTINTSLNGSAINKDCGSNHPDQIKALVIANKLFCGFAFDGDGDRVVAINSHGMLKNGDDLISIIATNPIRKKQGPVIGTVMSNSGLKKHLSKNNLTFEACNVGESEVVKSMLKYQSNLGGEPSGHIIIKEYLLASDGIFAALAALDAILLTNNLSFTSFDHQPQLSKNISTPIKVQLNLPEIKTIIENYKSSYNDAQFLIRYSGTEPLLRISVEASTTQHAAMLLHTLSLDLSTAITQLTKNKSEKKQQTDKEAITLSAII
jgi:phosphoglucosamine mutase